MRQFSFGKVPGGGFLLRPSPQPLPERGIALWDTIEECDIIASDDSSIRNVTPVDIMEILNSADIQEIYCNGNTSHKLFMKYLYPLCGKEPVKLPSTSPANAAWSLERLYEEWKVSLTAFR